LIIRINADWQCASDSMQWLLQRRRVVKGQDRWDNVSYHTSLDSAVWRLAQKRIWLMDGDYGPDALPVLCQAVDSLKREIIDAISLAGFDQWSR
jgi:hypothetical protein